ncbi:MAG: SurA N-terminal domain-containing protein [Rhodospirillales bacterium]|nr:SurA N-terminal domain-containing protein [Rhodospirillales bacterium]
MLQFIRDKAAGTVFKVMFGVLIISFAVWGIGDYAFLRRGDDTAIAVGDRKINVRELDAEYRQARERIKRMLGGQADDALISQFGILDQTVERLTGQAALDAEAAHLRLATSDAIIRQRISGDPAFRGPGGQFDRFQFQRLLYENGYSEPRYIELLRSDIVRQQLVEAVEAGVRPPETLVETIYRHRNEKRSGVRMFVANTTFDDVGTPNEEDLKKIYEANADRFTAPELRALSAVRVAAADVEAQVQIDDRALEDEFQQRKREFDRPEQRELKQMLFADETAAREAAGKIAGGKSFDEVVAETPGQSADRVGLGLVSREETLPAIAELAFAAEPGKVVGPVRTSFGWHVIEVVRIEPGVEAKLADVRAQIEPALRKRMANDKAFEIANKLEDQVTRGHPLDEAAATAGADVVKIPALDARGRDADGKPVALFIDAPEAVRAAFETVAGRESQLVETRVGAFFIVRVDSVTPAQRRPFDAVKDDAAALWKSQRQAERAAARAKEIVDAIGKGEKLEEVALRFNVRIDPVPPVLRTGDQASVPSQVAARLFAQKPGETGVAPGLDGQYVVRTTEIIPADPAADKAGMDQLRAQIRRDMASDVSSEYGQALRQRYGVTVNRSVVDRVN